MIGDWNNNQVQIVLDLVEQLRRERFAVADLLKKLIGGRPVQNSP